MKIFGTSEDESLTEILAASFLRLDSLINPVKPESDLTFIELVFERSRYSYNDSLEFFETNFQPDILAQSLKLYAKKIVNGVETNAVPEQ
ncbi:hypothetical protein DW622_04950 [Enterococcus faecalis]|uniref:hypothetical protein n=1 Tax=Enterococcus faecalis TaxID=1351 RepID=UPI0019D82877|nr:hypothetical protein [Enterococcus faecalis]EGO9792350.1 hypothetical protein [Enterococcus faecalis]EJZ8466884.1 hypothetical protein [Enterococcus faecalis]